MGMGMNERRLIEAGFPCHQVGAETQRERDTGKAPPTHRLHVWWARRPLTPSRAAILASILPADTDPDEFLIELGISKKVIMINQLMVTVPEDLLEEGQNRLFVSDKFLSYLKKDNAIRTECRHVFSELINLQPALENTPIIEKLRSHSQPIPIDLIKNNEFFQVETISADPAWFNALMGLCSAHNIRVPNLYGYDRAYKNQPRRSFPDIVMLDATAGGGSIPFEARRLGCQVIANDLNPVASAIEYATILYPQKYGCDFVKELSEYGDKVLKEVNRELAPYFGFGQQIPEREMTLLKKECPSQYFQEYQSEELMTYLYTRMVTCPNCGGQAPLMNSCYLSKSGQKWAVRIITDGQKRNGTVRFEPFAFTGSHGPNGEDPDFATVKGGTGTCIHCQQSIPSDEIKAQAQGKSANGTWWDQLYCVAAVRYQPKLDKHGKPQYYKSGDKAGQIKTEKISFFRAPTDIDFDALKRAEATLKAKWDEFDEKGLIPTEPFPNGNDMRPLTYGMERWCDMFTSRQLLGHLTAMDTLREMKPRILAEQGEEKGKAIITYLQFMIDKCLDYNSRQTRWEYTRGIVKGTFGRHDFSLKWTFGEMVFSGPNSGLAWGVSQILDAYQGIAELASTSQANNLRILNGSAANMDVASVSVDVICVDPPYYNNVQYAELSDFFYVWQKRTLGDIYPGLFNRIMTNKQDEAVANPVRDGSAKKAEKAYEGLMREIFAECHRVLKQDGIMTMMFTHKTQEAWETLTKALIESGWIITAAFPVDSESGASLHQKDMAAAASSIFISCRRRVETTNAKSFWTGFGGTGVAQQIREAVKKGLKDFEVLNLNPVDEMVASYGRALQVLSEQWPVYDDDAPVTPVRAMTEASGVVAQYQMMRLSNGRVNVQDVVPEAGIALTLFGIYGLGSIPFDDALSLAKSLNISLDNHAGGYKVDGRIIGINNEVSARTVKKGNAESLGYAAPLVRKGSKLRLVMPEERHEQRIDEPKTEWDVLQGMILAFREGDVPVARDYMQKQASGKEQMMLDLLAIWSENIGDEKLKKEAERLLYGLRLQ
jgi:adenine-specific DNA methylase